MHIPVNMWLIILTCNLADVSDYSHVLCRWIFILVFIPVPIPRCTSAVLHSNSSDGFSITIGLAVDLEFLLVIPIEQIGIIPQHYQFVNLENSLQ